MKSVGIKEAKVKLSELVRAAGGGEAVVLTDHGKPVAMLGPLPTISEVRPSDPARFRRALLALPHELILVSDLL